jgi:membrane fusion protein, heavy metal efflux system
MYRFVCIVIVALAPLGCSRSSSTPVRHETPATVEHPRAEAELSTVRLTPEAVKRVGIETVVVKSEAAAATRTVGGEIVVPEGRGVVVTAPVAGTLTGAATPRPGARLRRGDRLMAIAPLVPAERDQRIEAQREVTVAEAQEVAARQRLQRLEQLLKDGAASVRSVEEALAQHQVAAAALTAARERLAGVSKNPVGAQGELIVSAPFDGVVQRIAAVPGQTVAAAATLLELAQVDTLWVRVPVYAGDARAVDDRQRVTVRRLGETAAPMSATPVTAPLQGDPSAASVDFYYALTGRTGTLRPGERVLVELPLTSTEQGLVVPDTAVLYDIHGATWVYEDVGGNSYTRRRIEIARHAGDRAVVRRGLAEGVKVVTAGAAELFGTEFGAGH